MGNKCRKMLKRKGEFGAIEIGHSKIMSDTGCWIDSDATREQASEPYIACAKCSVEKPSKTAKRAHLYIAGALVMKLR